MAAAQVRRDLVEHRASSAVRKERLQVCLREVADADVAHKPPAMHKKRQRLGSAYGARPRDRRRSLIYFGQCLGSAYGARPRDRVISESVMHKLQRATAQALDTQHQILNAKR